MNVLFIVEMDGNKSGGLFVVTHNKIKTLLHQYEGHTADVYCLTLYDGWLLASIKKKLNRKVLERQPSRFRHEGVLYTSLYVKETLFRKLLNRFGMDSGYYKSLVRKIDARKYDLVSVHWGGIQGSLAYYLKKQKELPYAMTLYGSDVHSLPNERYKKMNVRNMSGADAVFFVSHQLKADAEKIGWKDEDSKAHIVYNAVDAKVFHPLSEKEIQNLKEKEKTHQHVVGFVGDLKEVKRADCLIELFKEIQRLSNRDITFYIIGDGPLKEFLQNEKAKTALDIRMTGRVSHEELKNYYNMMDCSIVPSRREGYGNVVVESQACGTPAIGADVGGIPESISDPANLVANVEETFINEFARKVNGVLEESRKIEPKNIGWQEIVTKELNVWNEFA